LPAEVWASLPGAPTAAAGAGAGANASRVIDAATLGSWNERLDGSPGVQSLSAPRLTTLHGRQAQVQVVRMIPSGDSTNFVPVGPSVDLIPVVSPDRQAVDLTLIFSFSRLTGYAPPDSAGVLPLPLIQSHQRPAQARVPVGCTLALAGGETRAEWPEGDPPEWVNPDETPSTETDQPQGTPPSRHVLLLITPTLIESDGNPTVTGRSGAPSAAPS
jgi:hypothetical protein